MDRLRNYYADKSAVCSSELWNRSDKRFHIKIQDDSADMKADAPAARKYHDFTNAPAALKAIMCYVPDVSGDPLLDFEKSQRNTQSALDDFEESQRQTKSVAEVIARYSSIDGMSSDFILTILYIILLITTFSIQFDF